ncbi:MAG: periplasmic heavy metal sensor [Janthinobacterium lividum]
MIRFSKPWLLEPWRTRVLWLSLGANLFLAALAAAPHLMPHRTMGPPGFDGVVERMARNLPGADADLFRRAMDRERPWYDMSRRRLDEARAEIGRSIAQEPYDPSATRAAMTEMQNRLRESSTRFDESLVSALDGLSPEGRARLAQDMARRRR